MGTKYSHLNKKVSAFLANARVSSGVTQVELANRLGQKQNYISNIERGQRRVDIFELIEIADALGVPMHSLTKSMEEIWLSKNQK